jgi:G3E family GTPase
LFIARTDGDVTVLANGCLCCDVQGDLEGVIGTLFGKRSQGEVPRFDRMLIETTGLADPGPIMQMLLNQPLVVDNFRLDSVVTTVDALHGARALREHPEAVNQVALADRLVLTKTDLVEPSDELLDRLKNLNSSAERFRAEQGVAPHQLFGADHSPIELPEAAHDHLHDIDTFSLLIDEPVQWRAFSAWLNRLKIKHADELLRVKGIVHIAGEEDPVAIHGVHHVFHPPMRMRRGSVTDKRSRIVFITRGLERDSLETFRND